MNRDGYQRLHLSSAEATNDGPEGKDDSPQVVRAKSNLQVAFTARSESSQTFAAGSLATPSGKKRMSSCIPKPVARWWIRSMDYLQENVVITPAKDNVYLNLWELFMLILLVMVAFHEPFVLAHGKMGAGISQWDVWYRYLFNRLVDVSFTVDLLLNFITAFKNSSDSNARAVWEKHPVKIAKRYLSAPLSENGQAGWFWFDIISVLSVLLALIERLHRAQLVSRRANHLIRLTRLARVSRMATLKDVVERYQVSLGIPFYISETVKFISITLLTVHWAACLCVICEGKITTQGYLSYEIDDDQKSWLSALIDSKGDSCAPSAEEDALCVYVLALYWATMTLTTVGYGDITPQNKVEYSLCVLFMLIAGFIWTYIVGSVVSLMAQVDPHGVRFKQNVDDMNEVMSNRNLPQELQAKLRGYLLHAKEMFRWRDQRERLKMNISEGLLQQVAEQNSMTTVLRDKVFWMRDLEKEAMLHIMAAFVPMLYATGEVVKMKERMVIVRDGLMGVQARVYGRDHVYGHDTILLQTEELSHAHLPTCLSFVYLASLEKHELLEICKNFPEADARLRKAQVRTAVFRNFLRCARQQKLQKEGKSSEALSFYSGRSFSDNTGKKENSPESELLQVLKAQQVSFSFFAARIEAIESKLSAQSKTLQQVHQDHEEVLQRLKAKEKGRFSKFPRSSTGESEHHGDPTPGQQQPPRT